MSAVQTAPRPTRGLVYAVGGDDALGEARVSARSARESNPGLPICLIHEKPCDAPEFDDVVVVDNPAALRRMKLHMDQCPYDQFICLDSDTLVVGPLDEVFALLDRFDFAACQSSTGYHYRIEGLPDTFPEYNSGVVAIRKSDATRAMISRWRELYLQYLREHGNPWDQRALRRALWESGLRLAWLPPEYNLLIYFGTPAMKDVAVVHGRPGARLPSIARELNRRDGHRVYLPRFGVLRPGHEMSAGALLALCGRALLMLGWKPWGLLRRLAGRGRP